MKYRSNGKLLLTGEYLVLEGATALALPTKPGQSLEVTEVPLQEIEWISLDEKNEPWLHLIFGWRGDRLELQTIKPLGIGSPKQEDAANRLEQLLNYSHQKNPEILKTNQGYKVLTRLDFPRTWGLGSSSTLVNNIASWFEIDAYDLLDHSFGGSGYDIASAMYNHPILYRREGGKRTVLATTFNPIFKDQIFFVHQNKKQDSRAAIAHFRKQPPERIASAIEKVDQLTRQMIQCEDLKEFELLIDIHETLMSGILNIPKLKTAHFADYPGAIKSLGAWGGDFMLVTGQPDALEYFKDRGYHTIESYSDLIL